MNFVVVPLSGWHRTPRVAAYNVTANLLAMMLFGAIAAYFVSGIGGRLRVR